MGKKNTPFNFSPYINKITKNQSYRDFLNKQKVVIQFIGKKKLDMFKNMEMSG